MLTRTLIALLITLPAHAQQPDYVVDGIHAGMLAAQVKAAGYTSCNQIDSETIGCQRATPVGTLFGFPVKSISARFDKPFTTVSEIRVVFDVPKATKACKPGKGKWADVVEPDCQNDPVVAITKAAGLPISGGRMTSWHRCGRYSLLFENQGATLIAYDNPSNVDTHKFECQRTAKAKAAADADKKSAGDFIKGMK